MSPDYVYTALIDVLSYRYRLDQDKASGRLDFKDDLEKALSIFDNVNSAIFGVNAISDTIILTCNSHNNFIEFLKILKTVFQAFLNRGLFIRGAVAYSKHFQSGRLTYSHAIARAYELESKYAIYPRIIIDENIIQMYSSGNNLPEILNKGLLLRQNGITFLNVVEEPNWNICFDQAMLIYSKDKKALNTNESAFLKHQWFENYLFNLPFANLDKDRYIETMDTI